MKLIELSKSSIHIPFIITDANVYLLWKKIKHTNEKENNNSLRRKLPHTKLSISYQTVTVVSSLPDKHGECLQRCQLRKLLGSKYWSECEELLTLRGHLDHWWHLLSHLTHPHHHGHLVEDLVGLQVPHENGEPTEDIRSRYSCLYFSYS